MKLEIVLNIDYTITADGDCSRKFKRCFSLEARLQQYMNQELPDVQAGFRKGKGTRDQIVNIRWIIVEKAMATRSSTLAWKIPWMEEPGRLQSMESLGVRHD